MSDTHFDEQHALHDMRRPARTVRHEARHRVPTSGEVDLRQQAAFALLDDAAALAFREVKRRWACGWLV